MMFNSSSWRGSLPIQFQRWIVFLNVTIGNQKATHVCLHWILSGD